MEYEATPVRALNSNSFPDVAWFVSAADQPRLPRPIAPPGLISRGWARAEPPGENHKLASIIIEALHTCQTVARPLSRTVIHPPRATATLTSAPPIATIERPAAQGRSPL